MYKMIDATHLDRHARCSSPNPNATNEQMQKHGMWLHIPTKGPQKRLLWLQIPSQGVFDADKKHMGELTSIAREGRINAFTSGDISVALSKAERNQIGYIPTFSSPHSGDEPQWPYCVVLKCSSA